MWPTPPPLLDEGYGGVEELANINIWRAFLESYASGNWPSCSTPPRPPLPHGLETLLNSVEITQYGALNPERPIYQSVIISNDTARTIRDFYCRHGYLPPPRSPSEGLRERCIQDYDLYHPKQLANIQAATDLVAAFFPGTLCTFSLYENRTQTHFTISGDERLIKFYGLEPGMRIPAEDCLCGHAVLTDKMVFIPDLRNDWRYLYNPFVLAGFSSFIGSSVSLEVDPSNSDADALGDDTAVDRVAIGALNVCFTDRPLSKISPQQTAVIQHITKLLETQLRASWEGHTRTIEAKMRQMLSEFIQEISIRGVNDTLRTTKAAMHGQEADPFPALVQNAITRIKTVIPDIGSILVVDTSCIHGRGPSSDSPKYEVLQDQPESFPLLGSIPEQPAQFIHIAPSAILRCLSQFDSGKTIYSQDSKISSELEASLPDSPKSHLAIPFFVVNDPVFLIIASSKNPRLPSQNILRNLVQSIGSLLLARFIQMQLLEEDAGKTAFLSSITHELRTPMHGLMTALDLAQNCIDSGDWKNLGSTLAGIQTCGHMLQTILNDVLDFKSAGGPQSDIGLGGKMKRINLRQTAEDIARGCAAQYVDNKVPVRLVFENEERDWNGRVNEAGYYRILHNGLSNAMKFCKNGSITLSLATTSDHRSVIIKVIDTGIGFDQQSLPHLLKPFTKADAHSPGTGLGLYITRTLVQRLGGKFELQSVLGQGTTFSVVIPVMLDRKDALLSSVGMDRRDLSAPGSPSLTLEHLMLDDQVPSMTLPVTSTPTRVLVVDDNVICRELLVKGLTRGPYPVITATAVDGAQAVDVFMTFKPDLVLTDISMPVMSGVEAAGRMRKVAVNRSWPPCRIYALTGLGSADERLKSMGLNGRADMDGWLIKGKDNLEMIYRIIGDIRGAA